VSYTALPCPGNSGLYTSCEKVHFFLVFLDSQTELPGCLSNIRAGAVLARDTIEEDTDVHESGCRILPTQPLMGPGDFQVMCSIKL